MMFDHSAGRSKEGRVLIVDDEEGIRKTIGLLLKKSGFDVVEAKDGREAITKITSGDNPLRIDTIICDIRMPEINGEQAIEYFRSEFSSVPIVVLTGFPDVKLAVGLMKKGVRDYLVKPVDKEKLLSVITKSVKEHLMFKDHVVV